MNEATIRAAGGDDRNLQIPSVTLDSTGTGSSVGFTFDVPNNRFRATIPTLTLADTTSRYPAEALPVWEGRIRTAETQGMQPLVQPTLERWFTEGFRKRAADKVAAIGKAIAATPVAGYVGCSHAIPKINLTAHATPAQRVRAPLRVSDATWRRKVFGARTRGPQAMVYGDFDFGRCWAVVDAADMRTESRADGLLFAWRSSCPKSDRPILVGRWLLSVRPNAAVPSPPSMIAARVVVGEPCRVTTAISRMR